jgi:hypothetical protein
MSESMLPTNYIYTSGPVSGSEAAALKSLLEKLTLRGEPFVIFSNVLLPKRQIDFIVVTEQRVAHLELKHFIGPIEGDCFGPWHNLSTTGSRISRVPSEGQNPRDQAIGAKYAISDEMQKFAPLAKGDKHFRHFESAVCIFPEIDPKSKLAGGDFRARVWSFDKCLDEMEKSEFENSWSLDQWRRFASDYLKLDCVSLAEATSPEVYEAGAQFEALCAKQRAALVVAAASVELGVHLPVDRHLLVVGPKGIGKSKKAALLALDAVSAGSLCLLVKCMHYRGDFGRLLHRSIAPYSSSSLNDLLRGTRARGASIVLILDGLDQVGETQREELLDASAALFEQQHCIVAITSSENVQVPEMIRGETVVLENPSLDERRKIYEFYAPQGTPLLDLLPFATPQDVKVAAQAAAGLSGTAIASAVYDTYFRLVLGAGNASVGVRVCRQIARHVFERLNPFLSHEDFDHLAEDALRELGAPIALIDQIKNTRLFELEPDGVSFSHELLVKHLVAADVAYARDAEEEKLRTILDKPLYRPLVADVIGRIETKKLAIALLFRYPSAEIFESAYLSHLGEPVRNAMERFLEETLQRCEEELDHLQLEVVSIGDGAESVRIAPVSLREPTDAQLYALPLVLKNLHFFLPRIGALFTRYGSCLLPDTKRMGKAAKLNPIGLLDLYFRDEIICSGTRLLCSHLLRLLADQMLTHGKNSAIFDECKNAFEVGAEFNPILDYAACAAWENCGDPDVPTMLTLFRKCWDSKSYYARLKAMDMIQFQLRWLREEKPEFIKEVATELESRLSNNALLNTTLFEILSRLGKVESPTNEEDAEQEIRQILDNLKERSPSEPDYTGRTLAERAHGVISNIFEDIFMDAYFRPFDALEPADKAILLNAAAMDTRHSFNHDFILSELVALKQKSSKSVFQMFCCRAPGDSSHMGSEHKFFTDAIAGLAAIQEPLPEWVGDNSSPSVAWKAIREIFYLELLGRSKETGLIWDEIESEDPLGGAVALVQVWKYANTGCGREHPRFLPEESAPTRVKRLLEIGLQNWSRLDLGHLGDERYFGNPFQTVCEVLGRVGDEESVPVLEGFTQDTKKGSPAIEAIRSIKRRLQQ